MNSKHFDVISAALLPIVQAAILEGESSMLQLAQAIETYADKVRQTREEMTVLPDWRCCDCGRHWTAPMTVAVERNTRPDNCPECFNKGRTDGKTSRWTVFKYTS